MGICPSAGTLLLVSVLTHLAGGDPAGLVGVSLTIYQVGRLGRKKEEGTTLIPILPFVVLGNHWSPGKVTWANPRLGKVTLNRARLHLSPEYRSAPLPALDLENSFAALHHVADSSMTFRRCWAISHHESLVSV